jgi:hypothetical protein
MALTFLIVLLLLELSLITLQGRAAHTELDESGRLALLLATENLNAELLSSLSSESAQRYRGGKASARLDKDFSYTLPGSDLTITNKWSPNSSLHHDTPAGWATFSNLVSDRSKRPALAFDPSACLPSGLGAVAPGQTVVSLQSEQEVHQDSLFAYTELFPFGLYAPRGNIAAGQISSFSNRCYDQSQTEQSTLSSGRPVDVLAKGDVAVAKTYSSGRAISGEGKVRLPEGSGGVPITGRPYPEALAAQLSQDLETLSATLAEGCVNKTRLFDDALFSSQMLAALFKGDLSALGSIFSVGQACKVPFFPIPGIQNGEPFMIVFYIMPPYPVDFSGLGRDLTNDLKGLDEQTREIQATQKQVAKLQAQLQSEQDKTRPDEDRIQELEDQLARTQQSLSAQLAQALKTSEDFDAQSQSWAEKLSQAPTPSSQVEDAMQNTQGWSYLYLMGKFLDIANALLGGEDPFAEMVSPSRVVHLGGEDPGWSWSEDSISIKATLAVPRGRTLHLAKSRVTVQGDVYLQPGAVLSIEGDLDIAPPADWNDFVSVPVEGGGFFPNGRLIMDPGSSLIVSGDLTISGGTPEEGSVVLTSAYGPCAGIDRLISAGGSIEIQNGMSPGVQLGDLFDGLAKSNSSLEGFNDKAFRPLVEQVAPQVAKLPWFGPWNYRRCWFADHASTFVISPLLVPFGEGGPWIFPLPYENCLKRIFADLSIAYSSELNFFTGENLYSQSYFWLFGRGATPVLTKVRPDLVARSVKNLSWQSVEWEAFRSQAESFLAQNGRSLVVQIFESEIVKILNSSALELVPLTPPQLRERWILLSERLAFPGRPHHQDRGDGCRSRQPAGRQLGPRTRRSGLGGDARTAGGVDGCHHQRGSQADRRDSSQRSGLPG